MAFICEKICGLKNFFSILYNKINIILRRLMMENKVKIIVGILSLGLIFGGCKNENSKENPSSDPTIAYSNKNSNKSNEEKNKKSDVDKKRSRKSC